MWLSHDEHFDALKGLSLLALTINHLILWPLQDLSFMLKFTYQSVGWITIGSIFFAIAGVQWGRRVQTTDAFWIWTTKRAFRLITWVVFATVIFLFGLKTNLWQPAPWQQHIQWHQKTSLIYSVLGLRIPWLIDIIWLHCFFGLFASALWKLPGLRGNFNAILFVSFLVWLVSLFGIFDTQSNHNEAPSWHHWSSWQFLFITSAVSQQIPFKKHLIKLQSKETQFILILSALIFFALKIHLQPHSTETLASVQKFGPLFALNSLIILTLLQLNGNKKFPPFIKRMGRCSLSMYGFQCVLVYSLGSLKFLNGAGKNISASVLLFCLLLIIVCSGVPRLWRAK